mmetsp:Transcript_14451/g.43717  ORF Transcript_14451/g.43717 Transcript_14451/m.43717 type:complete len:81 (+) Transcript_14451:1316-1558(+)
MPSVHSALTCSPGTYKLMPCWNQPAGGVWTHTTHHAGRICSVTGSKLVTYGQGLQDANSGPADGTVLVKVTFLQAVFAGV